MSWTWLGLARVAEKNSKSRPDDFDFYEGITLAARYWICTELPRVEYLADLCKSGEDSYTRIRPEQL